MLRNRGGTARYIVVPNSNDVPSMPLQPSGAPSISLAVCMLAAIDFDNQSVSNRNEVGNVRPNGSLTAELIPDEPSVA
jgi:hypothetical protein